MGRYLDIANEWERKNRRPRTIDGHKVSRVRWSTDKMTIFEDQAGKLWRRVHSWGMTWPVEISQGNGGGNAD